MVPRGGCTNGSISRVRPGRPCTSYVGHPDATGTINERHYHRILGYIDEARAAGVEVISLNGDKPNRETLQIPLYVVVNPPEHLAVMQEEIFGPVIAVKPYKAVDQRYASSTITRPLAAYVVSHNQSGIDRCTQQICAGGVGVNVFGFQGADPALPVWRRRGEQHGMPFGVRGLRRLHASQISVQLRRTDNALMLSLSVPYDQWCAAFAIAVFPPA